MDFLSAKTQLEKSKWNDFMTDIYRSTSSPLCQTSWIDDQHQKLQSGRRSFIQCSMYQAVVEDFNFFFSYLIGPGSQFKFPTFQSVKDLDLIGQVHMAITTKSNVWTSSSIIVQSITKIGQMTKEASIPIYPHLLHFCFKVQQGPFVGHISAHCSLAIHLIYL